MENHAERCRPLERVNYFSGQLLTADDLQAEQDYMRGLHRRHIRICHGWGIVDGLDVASGAAVQGVVVGPGFALSPNGGEICIPNRVEVHLRPLATTREVQYVAVRAIETKFSPVPVVGAEDAGRVEWSRVRESFELAVLDELPVSHDCWHGGGSGFQRAWRWVRRRVSGRLSRTRSTGHPSAKARGAVPDDDWVVLAKVVRTRVTGGGEHVRFVAAARRDLR